VATDYTSKKYSGEISSRKTSVVKLTFGNDHVYLAGEKRKVIRAVAEFLTATLKQFTIDDFIN